MVASFARLRGVDPGFHADHALTFEVAPDWPKARTDEQRLAFYQELTRRLEALPGVVAVGAVTRLPLEPAYGVGELVIEGQPIPPQGPPQIGVRAVTPGYFRAMAMPVLAGRAPSARDAARAPAVALVNRALAARYLGAAPVVGRRLSDGRDEPWMQVVGEVGDTAFDSLAGAPEPELFVPYTQGGVPKGMAFVVRSAAAPLALAPAVRRAVWAIDKDVPVSRLRPLADQVGRSLARPRFSLLVVAAFAGLALALAAAGIGALMAFVVAQRTREIGVRMALGAERRDALRLVLGRAARLALAGTALGIGAGWLLMRWLAAQLFAVRAAEPLPYLAGAACLFAAALAAAYLPARRASRVDPVVALRQE
jgi:putative ABC transport system permease protein